MTGYWWFATRAFAIGLVLDVAIAYALHLWLNPGEEYGWAYILLAIWVISAAFGLRRWIYRLVSTAINQSAITESTRQALVDAGIPAPPRFGMNLNTYLIDVADDTTLADAVRLAAAMLAKESAMGAQNLGLVSGSLFSNAANKALDKLRR